MIAPSCDSYYNIQKKRKIFVEFFLMFHIVKLLFHISFSFCNLFVSFYLSGIVKYWDAITAKKGLKTITNNNERIYNILNAKNLLNIYMAKIFSALQSSCLMVQKLFVVEKCLDRPQNLYKYFPFIPIWSLNLVW